MTRTVTFTDAEALALNSAAWAMVVIVEDGDPDQWMTKDDHAPLVTAAEKMTRATTVIIRNGIVESRPPDA